MLPRFFSPELKIANNSRFAQRVESQKIIALIDELVAKKNELHRSSKKLGVDSLDHAKYAIVSNLLTKFNYSINKYNCKTSCADAVKEMQEFVGTLRELSEHLKEMYQDRECKITLSQFRNKDREHARKALGLGVCGAIGAAFMFSTAGVGASALIVGSGVDALIENKTHLYNTLPRTYVLLNNLYQLLNATIKNLILTINLEKSNHNKMYLSDEENMVCPITGELMSNPVVCTLDGYSYEKSALLQWLVKHKSSPMNRSRIDMDTDVELVMIPNRGLKHIIDNYKLYNRQSEVHQAGIDTPAIAVR